MYAAKRNLAEQDLPIHTLKIAKGCNLATKLR